MLPPGPSASLRRLFSETLGVVDVAGCLADPALRLVEGLAQPVVEALPMEDASIRRAAPVSRVRSGSSPVVLARMRGRSPASSAPNSSRRRCRSCPGRASSACRPGTRGVLEDCLDAAGSSGHGGILLVSASLLPEWPKPGCFPGNGPQRSSGHKTPGSAPVRGRHVDFRPGSRTLILRPADMVHEAGKPGDSCQLVPAQLRRALGLTSPASILEGPLPDPGGIQDGLVAGLSGYHALENLAPVLELALHRRRRDPARRRRPGSR